MCGPNYYGEELVGVYMKGLEMKLSIYIYIYTNIYEPVTIFTINQIGVSRLLLLYGH